MKSITIFCIIIILISISDIKAQDEMQVKMGDTTITLKKYYFCLYKKGQKRDQDQTEADRIQTGHMSFISKNVQEGKICIAGPFEGEGDLRGILIFNVKSKEEAETALLDDPAIKSGRLIYEIIPWWSSKGALLK